MRRARFKQISAIAVEDILTGKLIPIVFALSEHGEVWQKVATKDWELLEVGEAT